VAEGWRMICLNNGRNVNESVVFSLIFNVMKIINMKRRNIKQNGVKYEMTKKMVKYFQAKEKKILSTGAYRKKGVMAVKIS